MSKEYGKPQDVPNSILADRLDELSGAVVARINRDPQKFEREFTVRIPAECDRDADIVLAEAARRLRANLEG